MTHTPGPWAPERKTPDGFYLAIRAGLTGPRICEVRPENQEANARLIAAAPDLLEALEDTVDILKAAQNMEIDSEGMVTEILGEVNNALRKARGEA